MSDFVLNASNVVILGLLMCFSNIWTNVFGKPAMCVTEWRAPGLRKSYPWIRTQLIQLIKRVWYYWLLSLPESTN